MNYTVTVDGSAFEVQVDGTGVRVNGRVVQASLSGILRTPLRQLVLDGTSRTYAMTNDAGGWRVMWGGAWRAVLVEDERGRGLREMTGGQASRCEGGVVKAPMSGLVIRVEVEVGQTIPRGTGVVVLEAMKMENEIRAPVGGSVSAIHVQAGEVVEKGAVLLELSGRG